MELTAADFQATTQDFTRRYPRGRGGDAWGLSIDLGFLLDQSPIIEVVRVKKPMDEPHMIVVLCRVASNEVTADQLAGELKRLWQDMIWSASQGFEAHTVSISDEDVSLEFLVVPHNNRYVTGMITISRQTRPDRKRGRHAKSQ